MVSLLCDPSALELSILSPQSLDTQNRSGAAALFALVGLIPLTSYQVRVWDCHKASHSIPQKVSARATALRLPALHVRL